MPPAGMGSTSPPDGVPDSDDADLFESLRALRKELADAQRVPAYIVFSDKVLWEMAAMRPTSEEDLLRVPGVGPAKLSRYGRAFLKLLDSHEPRSS